MTRIAFFSDVHGDLEAALRLIDRMDCSAIVCPGTGTIREETLRLLRERTTPCIHGNHDRWLNEATPWDPHLAVTGESLARLRSLPLNWNTAIDGVAIAVHHASPWTGADCRSPIAMLA